MAYESTFNEMVYRFAKLYVPENSFSIYEATFPWSLFYSKNVAGIKEILADNEENSFTVFDLVGKLLLKESTTKKVKSLPSGVYIVNGKKVKL